MIPGHTGLCVAVWLNRNQVANRLDQGITGFFKHVEKGWIFYHTVGPEFHGRIVWDGRTITIADKEAVIADGAQQYYERHK